jgi:uroporphyrin-III C-methyltransferase/precorrin-2 dehydrogenase/sirohydrochlorin ferrochelatase
MTDRPSRVDSAALVSLVGAGPGDPELLTWRAIQRLQMADLVLYDGLVPRPVLQLAAQARHVSVARRAGDKVLTQGDVNDQMIAAARRGERVVRLKAGDPFVLGRGGEEALALAAAGVPFEIVPGVSSAVAAPALAGIPVTHRGMASGVLIVSGHDESAFAPALRSLAPHSVTLVVLMGFKMRESLRDVLIASGWRSITPVAVVVNASRPMQRTWIGTLETLDAASPVIEDDEPAAIIIGEVVTLATALDIATPLASEDTTWQPMTTPRL